MLPRKQKTCPLKIVLRKQAFPINMAPFLRGHSLDLRRVHPPLTHFCLPRCCVETNQSQEFDLIQGLIEEVLCEARVVCFVVSARCLLCFIQLVIGRLP